MKSLPHFAFLLVVALMIYWKLHIIVVLGFFLWLFFFLYWRAAERWPRTTATITWFVLGMLSGGRRR